MHLASLPASHLKADLWENVDCLVCRTCRRTLLRLEELNLTTVPLETKTNVRRGSQKTAALLSIAIQTGVSTAANRAVASFEQDGSDRGAP